MAATMVISCPECDKQIKVSSELEGKKVRCKSCGHTFRCPSESGVKAKPDKDKEKEPARGKKAKPPAKPKPKKDDEDAPIPVAPAADDKGENPYGVTTLDLAPRCPHCAEEMESEDAVICLHCGYNTITRTRHGTTKTVELTGSDYFMWYLPGIICIFVILWTLFYCFFHHFFLPYLLIEGWGEAVAAEGRWGAASASSTGCLGYLFHKGIEIWMWIVSGFIIFFCARFAIKRLIINRQPPEKVKGK
jgi:predicted Zn finger-like uncharacterized protein